ncbi:hypothetical protein [Deinococcus sp.]|uniref:hypothetical protein n=1 Tax=Deinococcus sp. TaxID=47478 RepID=UPI0025EA00EF|nr:hypothetical protein [Deinococcus sp.]
MTGSESLKQREEASVTEQLNDLYADEDSALAPEIAELGFEVLRNAVESSPARSSPGRPDDCT